MIPSLTNTPSGWGFSTDPATYDVLRKAMTPSNVDGFANSIVAFVEQKGVDGIDIDWVSRAVTKPTLVQNLLTHGHRSILVLLIEAGIRKILTTTSSCSRRCERPLTLLLVVVVWVELDGLVKVGEGRCNPRGN